MYFLMFFFFLLLLLWLFVPLTGSRVKLSLRFWGKGGFRDSIQKVPYSPENERISRGNQWFGSDVFPTRKVFFYLQIYHQNSINFMEVYINIPWVWPPSQDAIVVNEGLI